MKIYEKILFGVLMTISALIVINITATVTRYNPKYMEPEMKEALIKEKNVSGACVVDLVNTYDDSFVIDNGIRIFTGPEAGKLVDEKTSYYYIYPADTYAVLDKSTLSFVKVKHEQ